MSEQSYLDLGQRILKEGVNRSDRTGVGTRSLFGAQMRFDLSEGFPLLTTKRVPFRLIVSELLWFIKGDTNIRYLLEHNNHIWDEWGFERWVKSEEFEQIDTQFKEDTLNVGLNNRLNNASFNDKYTYYMSMYREKILEDQHFAKKFGELGPVYGKQWRHWRGVDDEGQITIIDQLSQLIDGIKNNPHSRRHIISAWNPVEVNQMALPPCHTFVQFYVADGKLSCQLYQRSGDFFLGVPFNIASYALLTHLIAKECQLEVGEFVHTIGDVHLYHNHFEQMEKQLSRSPYTFPTLQLAEGKQLFEYEPEDIQLIDYQYHPGIKAPIAI
ncbi:thymidylate synthase [Atopobacter phocae]|uniref:thymidylate synthase n=1 Tax=Atopobacter phocae TaxID=136492 RepID=UPI0004714A90|nr:thymidylate synthase [Atopobacter phocae]